MVEQESKRVFSELAGDELGKLMPSLMVVDILDLTWTENTSFNKRKKATK